MWKVAWEPFAWELWLGNFNTEMFAWKLEVGSFSLGELSLVWDLSLGIFRLGDTLEMRLKITAALWQLLGYTPVVSS